jgi:hypothetical protein
MSVIAYRDGVMAGDTRAYGGDWQASPGQKAKIHLLDDGTRVGITAAVVGQPERVLAWLRAGADPEAWGAGDMLCSVLMVKANGGVYLARDSLYFAGPIFCPYYAIGSGADFALGAMAMGATARAWTQ